MRENTPFSGETLAFSNQTVKTTNIKKAPTFLGLQLYSSYTLEDFFFKMAAISLFVFIGFTPKVNQKYLENNHIKFECDPSNGSSQRFCF